MSHAWNRSVFMLACALLLGASSLVHAQQNAGDTVNGKRVYLAVGCFTCHGRSGQGGNYNYPVPPLAQIEWPVEAFRAFLRAAPNDMPAYAEAVLSDRDVADIYAFLRALPGRRPEGEIALLDQ